ncbi:hypothetical protein NDU88_002364 [Pleurodeles waltl]|uniref:Uncharacterized protein n=1 Tax=Pleurodeles waltl TaxID=8319 RepID=A0AAV7T271_PLEWA|nr:hypothetical protein NDU88_002364 [Pleurodeles waltl]
MANMDETMSEDSGDNGDSGAADISGGVLVAPGQSMDCVVHPSPRRSEVGPQSAEQHASPVREGPCELVATPAPLKRGVERYQLHPRPSISTCLPGFVLE